MILTILWIYVSNNDMITWFLIKIKATNRKDEGVIWNKTLDSVGKDFDYGHLYDLKINWFIKEPSTHTHEQKQSGKSYF